VKDPHKHANAQSVLFSWCISVVLCNSYAIYCLKHSITTPEKKREFTLNHFLLALRDELVPPCKLELNRAPSKKKPGKTISKKRKCTFCASQIGQKCALFTNKYTDWYCARCDKFYHQLCYEILHNTTENQYN
jgi:hypothetical protein